MHLHKTLYHFPNHLFVYITNVVTLIYTTVTITTLIYTTVAAIIVLIVAIIGKPHVPTITLAPYPVVRRK